MVWLFFAPSSIVLETSGFFYFFSHPITLRLYCLNRKSCLTLKCRNSTSLGKTSMAMVNMAAVGMPMANMAAAT